MKKTRRIRRSEATWRELFSRQAASGMRASEFCRREGINKNVFHRWRVALLGSGVRTEVVPVAALGGRLGLERVRRCPSRCVSTVRGEVHLLVDWAGPH